MIISLIVAIAKNNAIGKDNDLLWHLPADMQFFKDTTTGHHIITGRKNYMSIPEKYRPLPNRENLVVTRDKTLQLEGCKVFNSISSAIDYAQSCQQEEVFIIGGGEIYKQSIELVDKMYITHVDVTYPDADTFFPDIDFTEWTLVEERHHRSDEKNKFSMTFSVYKKRANV